jgi:hypothetical protein
MAQKCEVACVQPAAGVAHAVLLDVVRLVLLLPWLDG